jgi:hypothetical protein
LASVLPIASQPLSNNLLHSIANTAADPLATATAATSLQPPVQQTAVVSNPNATTDPLATASPTLNGHNRQPSGSAGIFSISPMASSEPIPSADEFLAATSTTPTATAASTSQFFPHGTHRRQLSEASAREIATPFDSNELLPGMLERTSPVNSATATAASVPSQPAPPPTLSRPSDASRPPSHPNSKEPSPTGEAANKKISPTGSLLAPSPASTRKGYHSAQPSFSKISVTSAIGDSDSEPNSAREHDSKSAKETQKTPEELAKEAAAHEETKNRLATEFYSHGSYSTSLLQLSLDLDNQKPDATTLTTAHKKMQSEMRTWLMEAEGLQGSIKRTNPKMYRDLTGLMKESKALQTATDVFFDSIIQKLEDSSPQASAASAADTKANL